MTGLKPDFKIIKKYYNDPCVNIEYFNQAANYTTKIEDAQNKLSNGLEEIKNILKNSILTKQNQADVLFFYVHYRNSLNSMNWYKDNQLHKKHNHFRKDLFNLMEILNGIQKNSPFDLHDENKPHIHDITIRTNTDKNTAGSSIIIKSEILLLQITEVLNRDFGNRKILPKESENILNQTYVKKFIESIYPLFSYIKEETPFKNRRTPSVYSFLASFIESMGFDFQMNDISLPEKYLKEKFKHLRSQRG